ncbi:hypothetical protein V9K67_21580 [Paraflavisolibacter sp. H34]|uniref:hypothetical protein n=1 Tax=Huijunlia imazamoxiresistens TaxID=3127457 RepID=UPI003018D3FC
METMSDAAMDCNQKGGHGRKKVFFPRALLLALRCEKASVPFLPVPGLQIARFSVVPGSVLETRAFTVGRIVRLVELCERHYQLPPDILLECYQYRKGKRSRYVNKAVRKYGEVCLSEIRRAIVVLVGRDTPLSDLCLGRLIGLKDHVSVICTRKTGEFYLEKGDEKFLAYYTPIKKLAESLGLVASNK